MQINEQELSEAVDRLREGDDNGLLVKQEDVFKAILKNNGLAIMILEALNERDKNSFEAFKTTFDDHARDLLTEALRAHKEQQAGLM